MHAFCLSAGSYFADLFTVEAGNGAYAFLPYLVTAAAVAILLAAVYFTFWRAQESRLLSRLRDAGAVGRGAGKTLGEVGYPPNKLRTRLLMRLLRSPACMLYRNLSTEEIDTLSHAFEAEMSQTETETEAETETETEANASTAAQDGAEPRNTASDGSPAPEPANEKSAQKDRREHARELRRRGLALTVREDTRFYIREERLDYVKEQAVRFSLDDYMGLLYTTVITVVLWFIVMNFLDNIVGLFIK